MTNNSTDQQQKQLQNNKFADIGNYKFVYPYPLINIDKKVFKKTQKEKDELSSIRSKHNNLLRNKYGKNWKKHIN